MEKAINSRNLGEIYTPEHISKLFYNKTKEWLGEDFEDKFLIWDCAWGTGNLTRDLTCNGELYCSTLRRIDIVRNRAKAGNKFVYNFLEEDVDQLFSEQSMWVAEHNKLPDRLVECLNDANDKPILFYVNPPYAATGTFGANNSDFKDGATDNKIKEAMRSERLGSACDQLYCQFIYKMWKIKDAYPNKKIYLALIIPPQMLTVNSYDKYREKLLKHFKFEGGALFRANNFAGLSNRWGISIQLWSPGETVDKNNFTFDLYMNNSDSSLEHVGFKTLYNADGEVNPRSLCDTMLYNDNKVVAPLTLSSGVRVSNKKEVLWDNDSIGYIFYKGNNVYHNCTECGIMCVPYSDGGGLEVTHKNFDNALAFYASRRSVGVYDRRWDVDKDEYLYPNEDSEAYKKLVANSLLFSLFNDSTHFSGITVDGKRYYNTFNFMDVDELMEMSGNTYNREQLIKEYTESKSEFTVNKLREHLSSGLVLESGLRVLENTKQLLKDTFKLRAKFDEEIYQVNNWDAGWYQIKWVLKKYLPEAYKKKQIAV